MVTVKQVNFTGNLISQMGQIGKIKLPQNCKSYTDINGTSSNFTQLSASKNSNNWYSP